MQNTTANENVRSTSKEELETAIYGLLRLISGYSEWEKVERTPRGQKSYSLINTTLANISQLHTSASPEGNKQINQLTRKLNAYNQIRLLEKFYLDEVIWDD